MNLKRFVDEFLDMLKYIVLLGLVSGMVNNFFGRSPLVVSIQAIALLCVIYGGLYNKEALWVENMFVIAAIVMAMIPGTVGVFTPRPIPFLIVFGLSVIALLIRSTGKMDEFTSLKRFPIMLAIAVLSVLF